jgi:uncharacterized protein (TIGR02466 family)
MNIEKLFPIAVGRGKVDIKLTAESLSFIREQDMKTNVGNLASVNSYLLDGEELSGLKEDLLRVTRNYFKAVYSPKDDVDVYITQSWVNVTKPKHLHHKHAHTNSFLSGVYYVTTDCNTDVIKFHKQNVSGVDLRIEPAEWNEYNSQTWWYPVTTGDVVIFPSWLEHEVPPTTSSKDRVSIAFNVFLKGRLGSYANLDELHLQ